MPRCRLALPLGLSLALAAVTAAQAQSHAALCANRAPCKVASAKPAGADARGRALTVVELDLGTKNPDNEHEAAQCRPFRREIWLAVAGETQAQKLFDWCNDGYGASGVGEDDIVLRPNRLTHSRVGGSAWRWEYTNAYFLVPHRHLTHRACSYHTGSPGFQAQRWDWTRFAGDGYWQPQPKGQAPANAELGCADRAPYRYVAIPLVRAVAGLADDAALPLGRCAALASEDGSSGFVAFGKAKPNGAQLRVLGIGGTEAKRLDLLVSVRDRAFATGAANWIHGDHIELWMGRAPPGGFADEGDAPVRQFGIGLDGKVHPRPADRGPAPTVIARHETTLEGWRTVTLRLRLPLAEDAIGDAGVAVVYSKAEGGKQARLTATAQVQHRNRFAIGGFYGIDPRQGACAVAKGAIDVEKSGIPAPEAE
jgi:hypothetical protein